MDVERVAEELTERKVVRRGLITGIAALGAAAMVKLSGTGRAEAAHDDDDVGLGLNNPTGAFPPPTSTTLITANVAADPGFQVVNGGSAASGKSGIVGVSNGAGGGGVRGYNDTAGGFGVGGNSANGEGVQGVSNSSAVNSGFGVRGVNTANGTGIKGVSNTGGNTTADGNGSGTGVIGKSSSGPGVLGESDTNSGVRGTSNSNVGVWGSSTSATGVYGSTLTGTGVNGEAAAASGLGIRGVNTSNGTAIKGVSNTGLNGQADGTGSGIGVQGKSGSGAGVQGESATGFGVYGASAGSAVGVVGVSGSGVGVWGQSSNNLGVVGTSTGVGTAIHGSSSSSGIGVHGESTSGNGMVAISHAPGVAALNATSVAANNKIAAIFTGDVVIVGSYFTTVNKSAIVPHPDGSMRMLYCTEATEAYFEDFGRAQLTGGVARVRIDPDFAPLVHRSAYHVFLSPEGPCKNLFVSQQDPNGFEVREMEGKSTVPFSYRIVAKRADTPGERLKRISPDTLKALSASNIVANAPRPKGPLTPRPVGDPALPVNPGNPNLLPGLR